MGASPSPLDDQVPLGIEPVLGWRAWRLNRVNGRLLLRSTVYSHLAWPPGEARRAICARQGIRGHRAPREQCTCGYYAADSWPSLGAAQVFGYRIGVVGAIAMWGLIIEHDRGARSEFAYPARLRLVCSPCIERGVVRDPVIVVGDEELTPLCNRHGRGRTGIDARAVQWELLNTYAVDLLPRPATLSGPLERRGVKVQKPTNAREAAVLILTGILTVIKLILGALFMLWAFSGVLLFGLAILGGLVNAVTGWGDPPTPTQAVSSVASPAPLSFAKPDPAVNALPGAPNRNLRPPMPPAIAMTCGVALGDHIQFVDCSNPHANLFGFAEQTAPDGMRADCLPPDIAYTSGRNWHECWFSPTGVSLSASPRAPNPFLHRLGGAIDGNW